MSDNGNNPHLSEAAQLHELAHAVHRLGETAHRQQSNEILELCVTDREVQSQRLKDWPVAGAARTIAYRPGAGSDGIALTAGAEQPIVAANEARIGGQIVNSGASAIILYLGAHAAAGRPAIWLAANGGSWDFRLGNVLWSGNVVAVSQGGASTVTIAEV